MTKLQVLCACAQPKTLLSVQNQLDRLHSLQWNVISATDGNDALFKSGNSNYDFFVVEAGLGRVTSDKVWMHLRSLKESQDKPILWIGEPLINENFVEETHKRKLIHVPSATDAHQLLGAIALCLDVMNLHKQDQFSVRVLMPGDYLMHKGDEAESIFILKSGGLKAFVLNDGQEVVLGRIEPGEFVGEMAYLSGENRSADVVAESISELIAIPLKQFEIALANKPSWGVALMKILAKRLRQANLFNLRK